MKKIISLVLSFTLIWGSITPSYAQLKPIKFISKGLSQEGISRGLGQSNALSGILREAATVGNITQAAHIQFNVSQVYHRELAIRTTAKTYEDISSLIKLPTFTDANGMEVVRQIFTVEHAILDKELLLLNTLPELLITKGFPIVDVRMEEAMEFYRRSLIDINSKVPTSTVSELGEEFAKSMASVSMLGFYGTQGDAQLILKTYETFAPYINDPVLQLAVGRSLLTLKAYGEFDTFVDLVERPCKEVWDGFKTAAESMGIEIDLPESFSNTPFALEESQKALLTKYSSLNSALADPSAKATLEWIALSQQKGMIVKTAASPEEIVSREVASASIIPGIDLKLAPNAGEELALGASPIPQSQAAAGGPRSQAPPQTVTPTTQAATSFVGGLTSRVKTNIRSFRANKKANRDAKAILARKLPLPTDLRSILQGTADEAFKKQALVYLYSKTNFFKDVLKGLPRSLKKQLKTVEKAGDIDALGDFLFGLYRVGRFDKVLTNLNNNVPTDILAQELAQIVADPNFDAASRAVYDSTPVLSPESNNFTGVVESLQDVDKEAIIAASRMEGWAPQSASSGKEVAGGWIYYENDIPVYYRHANGKLSDTPKIILHQPDASLYAIALSKLGLSTPKGIKIPKGMVLALDENGRFKLVLKPGHRNELEDSKAAQKTMEKIYTEGSVQVAVDAPYSTTDLLAIAKLLERGVSCNFELTLNAPNSFKPFVNGIGAISGLGIDSVMVGPFKNLASGPIVPNLVGGVGYVTPRVAGEMTPLMQKWGMSNSTFLTLASILTTLGIAIPLGINGFVPAGDIPLAALAAPMVVMILTASLLRSSVPLLLNHYKDPRQRTAANLQVSTWQQGAKVAMAFLAGIAPFAGGKFIAVPIAALATLGTLAFMMNTSMGKGVWSSFKNAWKNGEIWTSIKKGTPKAAKALGKGFYLGIAGPVLEVKDFVVNLGKKVRNKFKKQKTVEESAPVSTKPLSKEAELELEFQKEYEQVFLKDPDTKASLARVTSAYASYAASLMLLNQVAEGPMATWLGEAFGMPGAGKWITAGFAGAAFAVRFFATQAIRKGRFTDDQLTGISFLGLATMPLILAIIPYEGIVGLIGMLTAGILLNMSTAVPGQLDQTRLQNNVSSIILEQKNAVLSDTSLSPAERAAKLELLEKKEKHWSAQASKSYSTANSKGIYGVYAAIAASVLLPSIGVFDWNWIARAVFIYAAGAASFGAIKTLDMAASFMKALKGKDAIIVTEEAIAQNKVTPETFGMKDPKKVAKQIPTLTKGKENSLKTLKESLVPYDLITPISSEVKLTNSLKRMSEIHNRLVAAGELLGDQAVLSAFQQMHELAIGFQSVMEISHVSVALGREFDRFKKGLCVDGDLTKGLLAKPTYVPEGTFDLPAQYRDLLEARDLILELEVLARNIKQGGSAINSETYRDFIEYHNKAKELLLNYSTENLSESSVVSVEEEKLKQICKSLRTDVLWKNAATVPQKDIQNLADLLNYYKQ